MIDDPIVAEVRAAREAYAAKFNFNLRAMFEDLHRRTEAAGRAGRTVIAPPPKRLEPQLRPAKKAG